MFKCASVLVEQVKGKNWKVLHHVIETLQKAFLRDYGKYNNLTYLLLDDPDWRRDYILKNTMCAGFDIYELRYALIIFPSREEEYLQFNHDTTPVWNKYLRWREEHMAELKKEKKNREKEKV